MNDSGQNQRKAVTNSAKQFMLSKSAVNLEYESACTTSISLCHDTMEKGYRSPFEKWSNEKGLSLNKTLRMTKLTSAYFLGQRVEYGLVSVWEYRLFQNHTQCPSYWMIGYT